MVSGFMAVFAGHRCARTHEILWIGLARVNGWKIGEFWKNRVRVLPKLVADGKGVLNPMVRFTLGHRCPYWYLLGCSELRL